MFKLVERMGSTCVVVSPSVSGRGTTPLSTLIPGRMPLLFSMSTKGVPSADGWNSVSSKRICTHSSAQGPIPVMRDSFSCWETALFSESGVC